MHGYYYYVVEIQSLYEPAKTKMCSFASSVSKVSTKTIQLLGIVHQWKRYVSKSHQAFMNLFFIVMEGVKIILYYRFYASWQHTIPMFTQGSA